MPRPTVGFQRSFARHLVTEQRRAVLAALRERIGPEHTVGEVLDAAEALGWAEPLGDLSLSDLAEALLTAPANDDGADADAARGAHDTDDAGDTDEADEADDEQPASRRGAPKTKAKPATKATPAKGKAAAAKAKAAAAKAKAKAAAVKAKPKASKAKPARATSKKGATKKGPGKKAAAKAAAVKAGKTPAPRAATTGSKSQRSGATGRHAAPVDFDDRMSLDEAAAVLLPLVKRLGEATMQDLEDHTAGGRRKLRFHIGQLVRHGRLERHGMGRGTYYTLAS